MQRLIGWTFLLAIAVGAVAVSASDVRASQNGSSIGIAFGRNHTPDSTMDPSEVAGAPGFETGNWYNALGGGVGTSTGGFFPFVEDVNGSSVSLCDTTVTWQAGGTWSSTGGGEENNNFAGTNDSPSPDRHLMTGYIDTYDFPATTTVTVTSLPADIAGSYSVVVYTMGGVPNRPAVYTVNGGSPIYIIPSGPEDPTKGFSTGTTHQGLYDGPDYVQAVGDDPAFGMNDWGNYFVVTGLSGDVTITAQASTFRAVINAIEIVATPQ